MNMNKLLCSISVFAVLPCVAAAAEFFYMCDGDSGIYESPANWYVGNLPQNVLPGEDDVICCTTGLKSVRFSEPCTTHRVARVTLDKKSCTNHQKLFMDLNGGQLTVTGEVAVGASRYEGVERPYFGVTNGTLYAGAGIFCSTSDNNYVGKFEAFGPETDIVIGSGDLDVHGATSVINIGGGATLAWTGTGFPSVRGATAYTPGPQLNITGAGTTLTCTNGFRVEACGKIRVADKAEVLISGYSVPGQWGRQNRNSIGVDLGDLTKPTMYAELEIDNATFSVTNGEYVMVAESDRSSIINNTMTVKNGGVFNFSGSTRFTLAHNAGAGVTRTNRLYVLSGARFSAEGNTVSSEWDHIGAIMVGSNGACIDNGIIVSNGLISVNHIALGGNASASNNYLRIEGRTGRVLLNQVYAAAGNMPSNRRNPALGIHNNARVEFALGPDGFDNPPIELTTAVGRVYGVQNEELNQKARIVVEDHGFARKHPGETMTLIKTVNANNREYFEQLVLDATVVAKRENDKGSLSVSEDGKSLLYTAPPRKGLFVRIQ